MKCIKRICALALSFSLVLTSFAGFSKEEVKADDTVAVKYVSNEQQFRDYIDNNGALVEDVIETDWNGYGDVHKIVLPESGKLLLSSTAEDGHAKVELFSNSKLTARIGKYRAEELVTEDMAIYNLEKGTYYFRAYRWNGYGHALHVYTAAGFIPKSGKIKASGATSKTVDKATPVKVATVSSISGFKSYINNDGAFASQDTIVTDWKGFSQPHKFTVNSDGWLLVAGFEKDSHVNIKLYSNVDMSAMYLETKTSDLFDDNTIQKVYLKKGTYYYVGERWNGFDPLTFTTYLGFVPTSNNLSVAKIVKSKDGAIAKITFAAKSGMIRVEKGLIQSRHIASDEAWHTSDRGNTTDGKSIVVTANGTYSARLEYGKEGLYSMVTFKVSGLKNTTPSKPKVTSAKRNAKVVKGSAQKYMKVTIKIGSKSYTVSADKKGKWTLKLSKKLKKGTVIKVYAKNSANKKSKTCTYKVK